MNFRITIVIVGLLIAQCSFAQSFWFGPKVGTSMSFQKWNDFNPNPLLALSADFIIESYSEESPSSLYAQIGYHVRGSSLRAFTWRGESIGTQGFKFRNAVLELGGKRSIPTQGSIIPYYNLGVRIEYTFSTNLKDYNRYGSPFYPNDVFVRDFVYGATIGGGFEWANYSDLFRPYVEVVFCPDFGNQYYQGPIPNVIDQFGQTINLNERAIRNLSLEIRVGIKFLRKVEYID